MNSRERVLKALKHEEADRVPYDLSSTPVTGIHQVAYRELRSALGLPAREPRIWHLMQQLAWVDDDVVEAMQADARGLRPHAEAAWNPEMTQDTDYTYFTDEWGVMRRKQRDEGLCDKVIELKMQYWEEALDRVGDLVDVVQEGDDYGAQHRLQISPQMWRQIFKPRLAQLMGHIKKLAPHAALFFHSCGSIYDILPDLIEVGVDILNPVQVAAARMDSKELKKEFGDALTFWGGGVDTQRVLPVATPQQVRDEVKRRLDDFAPGGGFVFTPVHNIQADVPAENILAMREALGDLGQYGH